MVIGNWLRTIRQKRRLTLGNVKKLTGLSLVYLRRLETGKADPSLDAVEKLAHAFGVSMHRILYGEEEPPALSHLPNRLTADDIVGAIPQNSRSDLAKSGVQTLRKERNLNPRYDIFKIDRHGYLIWCASARTLEDAKAQVSTLREVDPCEYNVLNQDTRQQIRLRRFPEAAED